MSGPKVVRIVTLEEVMAICRGHLARLDAAVKSWRRRCEKHGLATDAEIEAVLERQRAIHALLRREAFLDLQKQAPQEIAFLLDDFEERLAKASERSARKRTYARRLAGTAAALITSLETNGIVVPSELSDALVAIRGGNIEAPETAEAALSRAFGLLAPGDEKAGPSEHQPALAERLGEGEKTETFSDWLAGRGSTDDARSEEIDRYIAELEQVEGGEAARSFGERAARIAAELSPERRAMLTDSLRVELAAHSHERRERDRLLSELSGLVAEFEAVAGADSAVSKRAEMIGAEHDGQAARAMVEDLRSKIDAHRNAIGACARRKAVLEALSGLGYQVREGMETLWANNGHVTLRSARRPDYGVKLSGGKEGGAMQFRAVGFGRPDPARDAGRERDVELLWCSDFNQLKTLMAETGGEFIVEHASQAGQFPLEYVEAATTDTRAAPAERRPMTRQLP